MIRRLALKLMVLITFANLAYAEEFWTAYKLISLKDNKVVDELNADKLMLPASSLKLFTAYAALKILKPDYKFETKVFTLGKVKDHILHGNLYIKFDGNPDFTSVDIERIAIKLNEKGIKQIQGNIIIDDTLFDGNLYPDGWLEYDKRFAFAAPISAIMVDKNSFNVKLKQKDNKLIIISDNPYSVIESNIHFINKGSKEKCSLELSAHGDNNYILYGCYRLGEKLPMLKIAIQNPKLNLQKLIEGKFRQHKMGFNGIVFANVAKDARYTFGVNSRPIKELIKEVLKDSDNIVSEVLFRTLAAKAKGKGTLEDAIKTLEIFVKEESTEGIKLQLKDGSGLSRKNLVSVNAFTSVLQSILQEKKELKNTLFEALPRSADSGTLENRFINNEKILKKRIAAKTGSMQNTTALVGYIMDENDIPEYAFALIINNALRDYKSLKGIEEEKFIEILNKTNTYRKNLLECKRN
jgi:D-alanyl-D-alanine carboxypeptidase/D-alanyl-D-alanine-endopeptidase (penicillin-binding protein 4)